MIDGRRSGEDKEAAAGEHEKLWAAGGDVRVNGKLLEN
jgi:hypothetical protein